MPCWRDDDRFGSNALRANDIAGTGRSRARVRAWCFACERGKVVDTIIWQKFAARQWPMTLEQAASRFRCQGCGSSDHVGLFPIERPPAPHNAPSLLVEGFFHGMRGKKKRRDDDIADRASAKLIAALKKRKRE
jgi:hypothetical protein